MEFVEYGNKDGQLVVYFHGAPGAMEECAVFDHYAKDHNLRIVCFDRFSIDNSFSRESYYQLLAEQVRVKAGGEPLDFIGFSIGAHVALEVSALLNGQVRHTHLISAVAPINADNFIDNMAGGLVFRLAMDRPFAFYLLTQCQKILAAVAPDRLVKILFSSSAGKDKALSERHDFKSAMTPILKHCFQRRADGYMRDIKYYVTWRGELSGYTSPVHIWHGKSDNWSPFSMAEYLCKNIPGATVVNGMEGLSHYSCLYQVAEEVCAQR